MSFGSAMKNIREGNERRARRGLPLDPFWEEFVIKKDPGWKARHPYESGTKEERIERGRKIISDIENRPAEPAPVPPPTRSGPAKWVETVDANGNVMKALHDHRWGDVIGLCRKAPTIRMGRRARYNRLAMLHRRSCAGRSVCRRSSGSFRHNCARERYRSSQRAYWGRLRLRYRGRSRPRLVGATRPGWKLLRRLCAVGWRWTEAATPAPSTSGAAERGGTPAI